MSSLSGVVFLFLVFTLIPLNSSLADHGAGHTYPNPNYYYTFDAADTMNDTSINKGTSGSIGDAKYFSDDIQSPFVLNSTGIINEAAIQNGTSSLDTQGEIRLGTDVNKSQWNFIHTLTGSNLTSINFWVNGDTEGGPEYPIIDTMGDAAGGPRSDGMMLYTQSQALVLDIFEDGGDILSTNSALDGPPDDGEWHMITILMDKGNVTESESDSFVKTCVDGTTNCGLIFSSGTLFSGTGNDADNTMILGSNHDTGNGNFVTENTFSYDDFAVWNGYILTNADIDFLYNNGVGNSVLNSTSTPQSTLKITKLTTGGDDTFNFTVTGPTSYNPSINTANGNIVPNLGTFGSNADAHYVVGFNDTGSDFVTIANGSIGQAVFQDGTATGGSRGEIRLGSNTTASQWDFLHTGNVGFNKTSINIWVKGDLIGSPDYSILDTIQYDEGNSGETDGFMFNTRSLTGMKVWIVEDGNAEQADVTRNPTDPFVEPSQTAPPDDGNWHMLTLLMDKGNSTSFATLCRDANMTACVSGNLTQPFTGNGNTPIHPLSIGTWHWMEDNGATDNEWLVDDLTIWQDHILSDAEIIAMWNGGAGSSAGATGESIQLAKQVGHWNFDSVQGGGGSGMGMDGPTPVDPGTFSVTEIIPFGWTLTNATCNDGFSSFSVDTVSGIVINASNNIECTFENTFMAPMCNGQVATIVGTAGDDFLTGTSGDDVIVALEGDDVILGNGGNDTICAGAGQDYVTGNAGADTIFGEGGKDHLNGRGGSDTIDGGPGDDFIAGRAGNDILLGGGGNDHISGENGNDTIEGNGGVDHISGGDGNDNIRGNGGDDVISGGNGDDDLDGDAGFDYCIDTVGTNTFTQCEITS